MTEEEDRVAREGWMVTIPRRFCGEEDWVILCVVETTLYSMRSCLGVYKNLTLSTSK